MWETIFNFLAENYPTLLWIIVAIFVSWQAFKLYNRFKKIEEISNNVPCNTHQENIKNIQGSLPILHDIKESIRKIEEYIIRNDSQAIDSLLRKCSPYKITFLGDLLLNDSGGRKCIEENIGFFIQEIEKMNPLVALDVEQYSLSVLNSNLKSQLFNDIKNYIYNAPDPITLTDEDGQSRELSIKIEDVLMVMSIFLRDKFFERHSEIDTSTFFEKKEPQA